MKISDLDSAIIELHQKGLIDEDVQARLNDDLTEKLNEEVRAYRRLLLSLPFNSML